MRRCTALAALLLVVLSGSATAQTDSRTQDKYFWLTYAPRFRTIEFWAAMGIPVSHEGLTEFWKRGPGAGMNLLFLAANNVVVGAGAEATLLSFRRGTFAERFPGVPLQVEDMVLVHLTLNMRYYLRPSIRMSPYVGLDIGVARLSGAEYKRLVDGVRHTYYEIPATARLTFGASAGVDYYVIKRVALQGEVRSVVVHNDPNVGLLLSLRMGVKLAL